MPYHTYHHTYLIFGVFWISNLAMDSLWGGSWLSFELTGWPVTSPAPEGPAGLLSESMSVGMGMQWVTWIIDRQWNNSRVAIIDQYLSSSRSHKNNVSEYYCLLWMIFTPSYKPEILIWNELKIFKYNSRYVQTINAIHKFRYI